MDCGTFIETEIVERQGLEGEELDFEYLHVRYLWVENSRSGNTGLELQRRDVDLR